MTLHFRKFTLTAIWRSKDDQVKPPVWGAGKEFYDGWHLYLNLGWLGFEIEYW